MKERLRNDVGPGTDPPSLCRFTASWYRWLILNGAAFDCRRPGKTDSASSRALKLQKATLQAGRASSRRMRSVLTSAAGRPRAHGPVLRFSDQDVSLRVGKGSPSSPSRCVRTGTEPSFLTPPRSCAHATVSRTPGLSLRPRTGRIKNRQHLTAFYLCSEFKLQIRINADQVETV